jgi:hypothetical protein
MPLGVARRNQYLFIRAKGIVMELVPFARQSLDVASSARKESTLSMYVSASSV